MSDTFDFDEDEPKSQAGLWIVAACLLVLMLALNLWPEDEQDEPISPNVSTIAAGSPPAESEVKERSVQWPAMLLADVLRSNPFQMNRELAEALEIEGVPAADSVQTAAADLSPGEAEETEDVDAVPSTEAVRQRELDPSAWPVKFVFSGPRGAAAMIGDAVYYEGDKLDGIQILRIEKTGVTVRPIPGAESSASP